MRINQLHIAMNTMKTCSFCIAARKVFLKWVRLMVRYIHLHIIELGKGFLDEPLHPVCFVIVTFDWVLIKLNSNNYLNAFIIPWAYRCSPSFSIVVGSLSKMLNRVLALFVPESHSFSWRRNHWFTKKFTSLRIICEFP